MSVLEFPVAARPASGATGRVVVLGGGGFMGSAIVAALASAGFAPVSVQRRCSAGSPGSVANAIEMRRCDATDSQALARLMAGAFGVVNAMRGDAHTMCSASLAIAEAAQRVGVARIVHLSSMAVYGKARGSVDETAPLLGKHLYARAKIASEAAFAGTGAVILRPGIVYGKGSEEWVGRIGRLLSAGRLGDLGPRGDGRCNLVLARDVGAAVVASLRRPQAAGCAINLGMPDPPRWNDFLVAFGRAIGAVPLPRIPGWRLAVEAYAIAPPLVLGSRAAGRLGRWPDAVSPALLGIFAHDMVLDCRRADRLLGFAPTPLAAGLAESAAWFKSMALSRPCHPNGGVQGPPLAGGRGGQSPPSWP